MANDIDGYQVLGLIAAKPELFGDIRADATKAARALVSKQLKSKTQNLEKIKNIFFLIKKEQFSNVVDGLKDAEIKTLAKKIDKDNTDIAHATASENRKLLVALAGGEIAPAQKQAAKAKQPGPKAPAKRKVTRAISSEAMAARWDGTNPDDPKK